MRVIIRNRAKIFNGRPFFGKKSNTNLIFAKNSSSILFTNDLTFARGILGNE